MNINGINYEVLIDETAEDKDAKGLVNTARMMRDLGIVRQLYLKRPKGRTGYFVNEFANGSFSDPLSLGALE